MSESFPEDSLRMEKVRDGLKARSFESAWGRIWLAMKPSAEILTGLFAESLPYGPNIFSVAVYQ